MRKGPRGWLTLLKVLYHGTYRGTRGTICALYRCRSTIGKKDGTGLAWELDGVGSFDGFDGGGEIIKNNTNIMYGVRTSTCEVKGIRESLTLGC